MESLFTFSPNSSDCDSDTELLQPCSVVTNNKISGQEKSNKSSSVSKSYVELDDGLHTEISGRHTRQTMLYEKGCTPLPPSKVLNVTSNPLGKNLNGCLPNKQVSQNVTCSSICNGQSYNSSQTNRSPFSAFDTAFPPNQPSASQSPQVLWTKGNTIIKSSGLQKNSYNSINTGTTMQDSSTRWPQMPSGVVYKNLKPSNNLVKTTTISTSCQSKATVYTKASSLHQPEMGQWSNSRLTANTTKPSQNNGSSCISIPKTNFTNIYYRLDPRTCRIVQHEVNSSKNILPNGSDIVVTARRPDCTSGRVLTSSTGSLPPFELSSPSAGVNFKSSSLESYFAEKTFSNANGHHRCRKRKRKGVSLGSIDKKSLLPLVGCQVNNISQHHEGKERSGDKAEKIGSNMCSSFDDVISLDSDYSSEDEEGENAPCGPVVAMNELDLLFEKMSEFCKSTPMEAANAIKTKLLLHQKLALNWMVERENTTELPPFWCQISSHLYYNETDLQRSHDRPKCINGGILADDMGLGKTLVLISLILTNHSDGRPMFRTEKESTPSHSPENDPFLQKAKEKSGTLKVRKRKEGFCQTSSKKVSTIKSSGAEFRKIYLDQLSKSKGRKRPSKSKTSGDVKDSQAGSVILLSDSDEDFPDVSNRVSDLIQSSVLSSNEGGTRKQRFGEKVSGEQTLIVCPLSVLSNWTEQFESHVANGVDLNVYVFYGQGRVRNMDFLKRQDVIITTYVTLASDFKQGNSALHKINWLRVILDEGHSIRNPHAQQTKAARAIQASRRWIVTGTPIQNRLTDLWSVIKFLRLDPFTVRSWWRANVVPRIRRDSQDGAHFDRVQKILRHISIRRMKTDEIDGEPIVRLPSKTVNICEIELEADERRAYEAMQNEGKFTVCKYFRMGAQYLLKRYAHVLAIIMRLRQMCCHPALCRKAIEEAQEARDILDHLKEQERMQAEAHFVPGDNGDLVASHDNEDDVTNEEDRERLVQQLIQILNTGDSEDCAICLETLKEPVITRCAHVFCNECIREVIASAGLQSLCPLCRGEISTKELLRVPQKQKELEQESLEGLKDQEWHSSAKVDSLIAALEGLRADHPEIKCIVVSQFTSFLSLIEKPLSNRNFNFVRFDGRLSQRDRIRAIEDFNSDRFDSPTIMLLSLTAGGVGLNLSRASRVFLMDPAWNPAVEEQCFDRCHRLGQTREVIITKYIIKDSIEERMLTLQAMKKDLVNNAFGVANQSQEDRLKAILTLMDL